MYLPIPILAKLLDAFNSVTTNNNPSAIDHSLVPSPDHPDTGSTTILLPKHQPSYAEPIDPHLVAFSIEADRWPDWAGSEVGKPNRYTQQLLSNLQAKSGVPPAIRVGADSEDRTHLDLTIPVGHAVYPPKTPWFPYPEAERISIGRDWYRLSQNLANGTPFTWGLNLKSLNITETENQAAHLAKAFRHAQVNLEAVEIGNEPELYIRSTSGGGVGNPGDWTRWTVKNYTTTWTEYAKAAAKHLDLNKTVLRIGDIQYAGSASGWAPQSIIQAGLFDDRFAAKHVKVYSEHMYQANYDIGHEATSGVLMDKWNIRGNLSIRAMDVYACKKQGLQFVLGETSSYSSHGSPGTSNTAESALWAIDYLLQASSLGIARAYLSHGIGYRYSSFQPIAGVTEDGRGLERPHIMPLYYGLLFVNEAIGSGLGPKSQRSVVELSTTHPYIVSYGIFHRKRLERVVIVNTKVRARDAVADHVEIELDGLKGATLKRLDVPFTQATEGLTWAGQDFDTENGKPSGEIQVERVRGKVTLASSSAVLLFL